MNLSIGQIRSKKPKKEKTAEEEPVVEMKKMQKKTLDYIRSWFASVFFFQPNFLSLKNMFSIQGGNNWWMTYFAASVRSTTYMLGIVRSWFLACKNMQKMMGSGGMALVHMTWLPP